MAQAHPDRVLTGHAAALVHGLPLLDIPDRFCLSSPTKRGKCTRKTTSGLQFCLNYAVLSHTAPNYTHPAEGHGTQDVTVIDGARVTTLARTVVDVAASQPRPTEESRRQLEVFRRFAEAIALADAALRGNLGTLGSEGITPAEQPMWPDAPARFQPPDWSLAGSYPVLAPTRHSSISSAAFLPYLRNGKGALPAGRAAEILLAASPLSDSVFESAAKALLIELKLDFFQQPRIVDEAGRMVARVDFLLPQYGIVIECDGRMKYELGPAFEDPALDTAPDARTMPRTSDPWSDRRRDFRLTNLGYRVIHLTWDGLFDGSAAAAIRKAIHAAQTQLAPTTQPRGRWFDAATALPPASYQHFRDAA